jgi:hypothetical protein
MDRVTTAPLRILQGPPGPPGPQGPDGLITVITSDTEPVGAEIGTLWYDPTGEGVETTGEPVSIGVTFDGAGSPVVAASTSIVTIPFDCTITGWRITAPLEVGSATIAVAVASFEDFPVFTDIHGLEEPILDAAQKAEDLTIPTWTTGLTAGDMVRVTVVSADTVTMLNVTLFAIRA